MKNIIKISALSLALISTSLQADELSVILNEYKQQNYQQALELSKKHLETDPANLRVNLLLGNSAFMLKDYHEAIAAYDRVLMLDPNNSYASLQMAEIYYQTSNKTLLQVELDLLNTKDLNQTQKERVDFLRKSLDDTIKQEQSKFYQGSFSIGLLHDSNINHDIGNKTFHLPSLNADLNGDNEKSGVAHFENVYLNLNSKADNNFGIDANFNLYNKTHIKNENRANDLTLLSIKAGPTYSTESFMIKLPLLAEKIMLNRKSYALNYGIGLEAIKAFNWGLIDTGFEYKVNDYAGEEGKAKNSDDIKLYFGAKLIDQEYLISAFIDYIKAKEDKDLRSDISYDRYALNLDAYKKITTNLIARASFKVQKYDYKDFNTNFLNKRDDTLLRYGIGADYVFSQNSSVSVGVDYLDKSSNQAIYEYDKLNLSVYYTYRF